MDGSLINEWVELQVIKQHPTSRQLKENENYKILGCYSVEIIHIKHLFIQQHT